MRALVRAAGVAAIALTAAACVPPPPPPPPPPTTVPQPQPHWSVRDDGQTVAPPSSPGGFNGSDGSGRREALGAATRAAAVEVRAGGLVPLAQSIIGAESVIGADDRQRVADPAALPFRAIALLTYEGRQLCTGFLVGPSTVLTSGHCLHDEDGFVDRTKLAVIPAYDPAASPAAPWGSCGVVHTYTTVGWTKGQDSYDLGALDLGCTVGERTGWFGVWQPGTEVSGLAVQVTGYPGDKARTMWTAAGTVRAATSTMLYYDNDTQPGNSGSPVHRWREPTAKGCAKWCVAAVHGYGVTENAPPPDGLYNHGVRMTQRVVDAVTYWTTQ